jgi:hypothetical protein
VSMACELWPLDPSCLPEGWAASPQLWDDEQRLAVEAATEILKSHTAGIFGLCALKVRPCRKGCADRSLDYAPMGVTGSPWTPMLIDGHAVNLTCGGCYGGDCGCSRLCETILDPGIHDILQVRIDGEILASTAYRVDDGRKLVRIDGDCWPDCQELALADTEPGTFSVLYRTGNPVPAGGRRAATELSVELWKSCRPGRGACPTLSDRVTQVVREGISYSYDNLDVYERGRTGLNRVDMWLASVNPYNVRSQMRAWSPDIVRSRTTTWPQGALPPSPGAQLFVHVQSVAALVWTVAHNLGFYPAGVRVEGAASDSVGDVTYVDANTVRIVLHEPLTGVAYLS